MASSCPRRCSNSGWISTATASPMSAAKIPTDALASVANYLKKHGWRQGAALGHRGAACPTVRLRPHRARPDPAGARLGRAGGDARPTAARCPTTAPTSILLPAGRARRGTAGDPQFPRHPALQQGDRLRDRDRPSLRPAGRRQGLCRRLADGRRGLDERRHQRGAVPAVARRVRHPGDRRDDRPQHDPGGARLPGATAGWSRTGMSGRRCSTRCAATAAELTGGGRAGATQLRQRQAGEVGAHQLGGGEVLVVGVDRGRHHRRQPGARAERSPFRLSSKATQAVGPSPSRGERQREHVGRRFLRRAPRRRRRSRRTPRPARRRQQQRVSAATLGRLVVVATAIFSPAARAVVDQRRPRRGAAPARRRPRISP